MTHSVYHVAYGIELNLSLDDLGHPDRPGLWDEIYRHCAPGILLCVACREQDPGCPQYMYVQIKNGKRIAVHHNPSIRHSVHNESPRHKALKERIATAAQRAGFEVRLEDEAADGLRRTDVLIR